MSAYYIPRPSTSSNHGQPATSQARNTEDSNASQSHLQLTTSGLNTRTLSESIYVFPNPSSAPPSPGSSSSLFSVPTDFSPSSISASSSRSPRPRAPFRRQRASHHGSASTSSAFESADDGTGSALRRSRSRSADASTTPLSLSPSSFYHLHGASISPLSPLPLSAHSGAEVEVWDWAAESNLPSPYAGSDDQPLGADGEGTESDSWVLEEEIERVSRWDIDLRLRQLSQRAAHASALHASAAHAPAAVRRAPLQAGVRARYHSVSSLSSGASAHPHSAARQHPLAAPQLRLRIPLLSFFASLFMLDAEDDPVLRLLTQPGVPSDGESVLFPGSSVAGLGPQPHQGGDRGSDTGEYLDEGKTPGGSSRVDLSVTESSAAHGLQRLFLSASNELSLGSRSLRAGFLAVPDEIGFPIVPGIGVKGLVSIWRAVNEVYARSGQAWKEVWVG